MDRIVVVGNSGAGKTSLARRIAEVGGHRHIELDAIHHLDGWTPIDQELFRSTLAAEVSHGRWVVDGNYISVAGHVAWEAADTIVWVDPPRWRIMARIIRRTIVRGLFRVELWNGNRERLSNMFRREPEENIVLWAWTTYPKLQQRYGQIFSSDEWGPRSKIRLGTRADVEAFLETVHPPEPGGGSPVSRR